MATDPEFLALKEQVQHLADTVEIYRIVSSYGPKIDSMNFNACAEIWTEDGTFEVSGYGKWSGREGIRESLASEENINQFQTEGLAHFLSMPYVRIDGDRALATNYGLALRRREKDHILSRTIAIRWELSRTENGWKVNRRVNQLFDGSEEARKIIGGYESPEWPVAAQEMKNVADG